jgi:hypothetical protein
MEIHMTEQQTPNMKRLQSILLDYAQSVIHAEKEDTVIFSELLKANTKLYALRILEKIRKGEL